MLTTIDVELFTVTGLLLRALLAITAPVWLAAPKQLLPSDAECSESSMVDDLTGGQVGHRSESYRQTSGT